VSKTTQRPRASRASTAAITASPNPVPHWTNAVQIAWGSAEPSAEVRVSTNGGAEELFAKGSGGAQDAAWIEIGPTYDFRLYGKAGDRPLASVTVRRDEVPWRAVADGIRQIAVNGQHEHDLAELLAEIVPRFAFSPYYERYFGLWEEHGFHLTPVHFYWPLPDTRTLGVEHWATPSQLPGLDFKVDKQLALIDEFSQFRSEYDRFPHAPTEFPHEFHFDNELFSGIDALGLYCMLRHAQPNLVIEVGSGFSTRVAAQAALQNSDTRLIAVEPYPDDLLTDGFPGLSELVSQPVQELDIEFFDRLGKNDVLFIDTSHVVRTGGDVTYLLLEVVPRLRPGVLVHVHDVFLPYDYPRDWLVEKYRFWSEQYLLAAFLAFNQDFEVVLANHYLSMNHSEALRRAFSAAPHLSGLSFWFRRAR
jgi:hypothetical protein